MATKQRLWMVVAAAVLIVALLLITRPLFVGPSGPAGGLTAGFDAEFFTRPDGYKGLCAHYGFSFPSEPKQMDPGVMYRAVADGAVDVIDGFATDGRIAAFNLVVLLDDKGFFPPYYAAPVVRQETLEKHPGLAEVLNLLSGRISDKTMQRLNYEADEKGRKPHAIAREFLVAEGLIAEDAEPTDGSAGTVAIGSKHFTEQEILGELMGILIETRLDLAVKRRLGLGGTMICFNALKKGDLDLYAEYTGTGLVNVLERQVIADPDAAYEAVKKDFAERWGLVWLRSFGFNNTYTLTMRRDQAKALGIETISDLAARFGGKTQRN